MGTCMQLMVTLGIFFVNLNCETDWRLFSGICIVFPAVLGLWMFWMPRSVLLILLSHYFLILYSVKVIQVIAVVAQH